MFAFDKGDEDYEDYGDSVVEELEEEDLSENAERGEVGEGTWAGRTAATESGHGYGFVCKWVGAVIVSLLLSSVLLKETRRLVLLPGLWKAEAALPVRCVVTLTGQGVRRH